MAHTAASSSHRARRRCVAWRTSHLKRAWAKAKSSLPMYSKVKITVSSERNEEGQSSGWPLSREATMARHVPSNSVRAAFLFCSIFRAMSWPDRPTSFAQSQSTWNVKSANSLRPTTSSTLPIMRQATGPPTRRCLQTAAQAASGSCSSVVLLRPITSKKVLMSKECTSVSSTSRWPMASRASFSTVGLRRMRWNGGPKKAG
mmetsp:Transcript_13623/g.40481  ORF Transcript_13623/g.40481 Transcript_13623/m.40481 type:complete len:202 (+) Transcript_13623:2415-3020(+)